jgi:hypothetical protein
MARGQGAGPLIHVDCLGLRSQSTQSGASADNRNADADTTAANGVGDSAGNSRKMSFQPMERGRPKPPIVYRRLAWIPSSSWVFS